jgi:hypothetical protein
MTRMHAVYAEHAIELSAFTRMPEGVRDGETSGQSMPRRSNILKLAAAFSLID